jgi:hypothetical protein
MVIVKNEKRKAIAQNLKLKYIVLYIDFYISYLTCYIAKMEN